MKSVKILLFFLFFFSLYSCGEGDEYFITVDIEKNDSDSNDDNEDNEGDGKNDDSGSFSTNGILISSKAYLYTDTTTALPKL